MRPWFRFFSLFACTASLFVAAPAEQGKLAAELHEHEGLLGELTGMCTDLREITQEALTTAKRSGARADEVCAAWESVNRSRANVRAQSAGASLLGLLG